MSLVAAISAGGLGTGLLATAVFAYIWAHKRADGSLLLTVGWVAGAIWSAIVLYSVQTLERLAPHPVAMLVALVAMVSFVLGTHRLVHRPPPRWWVAPLVIGYGTTFVLLALGIDEKTSALPGAIALGVGCIATGVALFRARTQRRLGKLVAAACFVVMGGHLVDYPWIAHSPALAPWGHALTFLLIIGFAAGLLLVALDSAWLDASEQHRQYRDLVDRAVEAIFQVTHDGTITAANPALADMLGYGAPGELVGAAIPEVLCADPPALRAMVARLESEGRVDDLDVVWRRRDGERITVQLNGRAVSGPNGHVAGFEFFGRDVTHARRTAAQRAQTQKMEALGRVTGGIAHDFNNLLTVILANARLLAESDALADNGRERLEHLQTAARRAAGLTRQLLTFGRQHGLEVEVVDVARLVADLDPLLRPLISEAIELELDVPAVPVCTRADPTQMQQVLLNLAINGADAMPEGGRLGIRVRRLSPSNGGPGDVELEVSDTGTGIAEHHREHLFEPFFTTKEVGAGTGLGLATAHSIVTRAGGCIEVDHGDGRGTTFRVRLPGADAEALVTRAAGHAEPAVEPATILVAEDEPLLRAMAELVLRREGHAVIVASNGAEAVELAAQQAGRIDLLITDVVMPKMSGVEAARRMRVERPDLPVIFISGYPNASGADELEAVHNLSKPFEPDDLLALVARALTARQVQAAGDNPPVFS